MWEPSIWMWGSGKKIHKIHLRCISRSRRDRKMNRQTAWRIFKSNTNLHFPLFLSSLVAAIIRHGTWTILSKSRRVQSSSTKKCKSTFFPFLEHMQNSSSISISFHTPNIHPFPFSQPTNVCQFNFKTPYSINSMLRFNIYRCLVPLFDRESFTREIMLFTFSLPRHSGRRCERARLKSIRQTSTTTAANNKNTIPRLDGNELCTLNVK